MRLGNLRGYDPYAEQAFTRRKPGMNPIALELNRLAELRGLHPAEETEPPAFTDEELARDEALSRRADELARAAEETRNALGQTQGEERDADAVAQMSRNPKDKMGEYVEEREGRGGWTTPYDDDLGRGGDSWYEMRERMAPEDMARLDTLDRRVDEFSRRITEYVRSRPDIFTVFEDGSFNANANITPNESMWLDRMFNRRNRVIDRIRSLQGQGG